MDRQRLNGNHHIRVAFFGAFMIIALAVLLVRLWNVQVLQSERYALMSEGNRIRTLAIEAPRGRIFDKYGRLIVGNKLTLAIYVMPAECKDKKQLINNLASLLGRSAEDIDAKLKNRKYSAYFPKVIEEDASISEITQIKERPQDFPGVFIEPRPNRYYPYGSLAAHVLGHVGQISDDELETLRYQSYTSQDIIGKSGIEYQYDQYLQGSKGIEFFEVNALGIPLRVLQKQDSKPGADMYLTIDLDIQKCAEGALVNAINRARAGDHKHAEAGAIVVLDANTSEVLAMASYPTFDPTIFVGGISSTDWEFVNDPRNLNPLQPRAYASAFPPGSSFKPIAGLGALAEKILSTSTAFNCSGTWSGFGSAWTKSCWKKKGHGHIGFDQAIVQSCDIAFYNIGLLYYHRTGEKLQEWSRNLGLGAPTGIDLPFESPGCVPDKAWKKVFHASQPRLTAWVPGDTVNMVIGQGDLLVTPLQLANAYAAIANRGELHEPRVLGRIQMANGKEGKTGVVKSIKKVPASPENFIEIQNDLHLVTTEGTAAGSFWDFPVPVAGKTGTAQVGGKDDQSWFAAYAPADKPHYVVLATIEQGGHGSTTAAPAVKEVMARLFNIELDENLMYKAKQGETLQGSGD